MRKSEDNFEWVIVIITHDPLYSVENVSYLCHVLYISYKHM